MSEDVLFILFFGGMIVVVFGFAGAMMVGEHLADSKRAKLRHEREMAKLRHRQQQDALEPTPQAVCGCGDSLAYHDPATGACHQEKSYRARTVGDTTEYEMRRCPCRQYSGPMPLDNVIALPLSGDSGTVPPALRKKDDSA